MDEKKRVDESRIAQPRAMPPKANFGLSQLFQRFSGYAMYETILSRKINRYSAGFLDAFPPKVLNEMVDTEANLIDWMPDQRKVQLKMMAMPYLKMIVELKPEAVYTYLPEKYRIFFEAKRNGYQWALRQLALIKEYLLA